MLHKENECITAQCRVAERLFLGEEGGRRAVSEHEARVESAVLDQEGRQLAVSRVCFSSNVVL